MNSITIDLPTETYKRLEAQARSIGQDPATLSRRRGQIFTFDSWVSIFGAALSRLAFGFTLKAD